MGLSDLHQQVLDLKLRKELSFHFVDNLLAVARPSEPVKGAQTTAEHSEEGVDEEIETRKLDCDELVKNLLL